MGTNYDEKRAFSVEEPEPGVYNCCRADPPVWDLTSSDVLALFQQLQSGQVLPLKWKCPGRHPPKTETVQLPQESTSDDESQRSRHKEQRAPEPSAFDFDEEASAKVKLTPRTPVSVKAKRPEKRVARMDNVLNSLKRQQKAEREARKSQLRYQGNSTPTGPSYMSTPTGSPTPGSPLTSVNTPRSALVTETPRSVTEEGQLHAGSDQDIKTEVNESTNTSSTANNEKE